MVGDVEIPEETEMVDESPARRRRWRAPLAVAGVMLLGGLGWAWLSRDRIADDYIAGQLKQMDLPATYTVAEVGTGRQVLRHVVVGNPKAPDLTVDEVVVEVSYGFSGPQLGRITLVRPRLYGSVKGGKPSFGSLDKVLFTGSKEPFRLPDYDLKLVDGRARIDSDVGPVGIKAEGEGALRNGFAGTLAAIAPSARLNDCDAENASLYGSIKVKQEKPHFTGPLRIDSLACKRSGLALEAAAVQLDAVIDQAFNGGDGTATLETGRLAFGASRVIRSSGKTTLSYRKQALTAKYALSLANLATPGAAARSVTTEGMLRTRDGLAQLEADGALEGSGLNLGPALDNAMAGLEHQSSGTLAAPMLGQMRSALRREGTASSLSGMYTLHQTGDVTSLVVPQAALRGGSGDTLLALSRFQLTLGSKLAPRFAGNFTTGGAGLPQIAGRMERRPGGQALLRMTMAEYRAGEGRLSIPEMLLAQAPSGALGFTGRAVLSGPLPGGGARNLALPVEGNWSQGGGLAVWRRCTPVSFDSLTLANLTLDRRALTLCPQPGGAILVIDGRGTRLAAGMPALDVSGRLGDTPIRLGSGPLGLAMPGVLAAQKVQVTLGQGDASTRFLVSNLDARIGNDIAGRFSGSDIYLAAVPLDLHDAAGDWRYAGGVLSISGATFRLEDRQTVARFQPLIARDAQLTLANNAIDAEALLREPRSNREVVHSLIRHDIGTGRGHADLKVDGITFDKGLQPDTLSRLALGVIANAQGTVKGTGRIDWNPDRVTSTGRFSTDKFDFAAAFGPVTGASGTVQFTDLLGLVTAPDQRVRIASINPGIAVDNGEVSFQLEPDSVLRVNGAKWPFLDGEMELLPTRMVFGASETRRYELKVSGINAARFIERMELPNISATGSFDGSLPLVFDADGGRIEGGLLISRPPGGNVSYVGQLSYKDMGAIANYAFDALKSMDYTQMRIAMDGALEGEIVTRVRFTGVKQGEGAKRNFITRRLAGLPIQFNVNLRAPFYQLITSFKAMYDPNYIRDPRMLGLIGADGKPLGAPAKRQMSAPPPQSPSIQPPVSEKKP
ncbi:MAG: YdbH domain-containing protein [Sphingomonadales bacterium]|nr:YdbH domain-containing protein [Sphingomonadales bacterium]